MRFALIDQAKNEFPIQRLCSAQLRRSHARSPIISMLRHRAATRVMESWRWQPHSAFPSRLLRYSGICTMTWRCSSARAFRSRWDRHPRRFAQQLALSRVRTRMMAWPTQSTALSCRWCGDEAPSPCRAIGSRRPFWSSGRRSGRRRLRRRRLEFTSTLSMAVSGRNLVRAHSDPGNSTCDGQTPQCSHDGRRCWITDTTRKQGVGSE